MRKSLRMTAVMCAAGMLAMTGLAVAQDNAKSTAKNSKNGQQDQAETRQAPYLGVAVEAVHPAFFQKLVDVLEHKRGVRVAQVAKGSPAEKAGLKPNDVLMTFGDQKLFFPQQLVALVHEDTAGQKVNLGIVRNGKAQTVSVTLGQHAVQKSDLEELILTGRTPRPSSGQAENKGEPGWTSFDSLTLKSLGKGRYSIEIGYETKDGKIKHESFEGTREDIHKRIMAHKDLPASERQHLLRTLDMPSGELGFDFPAIR